MRVTPIKSNHCYHKADISRIIVAVIQNKPTRRQDVLKGVAGRSLGQLRSNTPSDRKSSPEEGEQKLKKFSDGGYQNCPRLHAHIVAKRCCLLIRRQADKEADTATGRQTLLSLSGNTPSQTLQPFGIRCQPYRCLRSSFVPSVVSATKSNPTQSVSLSLHRAIRCHP